MRLLRTFLAMLSICSLAQADDVANHKSVDVHRSADGQLTAESLENVELLKAKAIRQGYVTLWLTANVPFNPNTERLSDRQIKDQNDRAWSKFVDILRPLVDAGLVWRTDERPNTEGPGCLVRANARGLAKLIGDTRIRHIHEAE